MTSRPRTDNFRANVSTLVAMPVGVLITMLLLPQFGPDETGPQQVARSAIMGYLFTWPTLVLVFTWLTHRDHTRYPLDSVRALTRIELERRTRWWSGLLGTSGAVNWTLAGGFVAVTVTVTVAVSPPLRDDVVFLVLCAVNVVASWLLMVFVFALEYFRMHLVPPPEGEAAIDLDVEEPYRLDDFLTLSVLLTTMAATVSAHIRSRAAWTLVRVHVLCAFAFNTVIVAMTVSLLATGITS